MNRIEAPSRYSIWRLSAAFALGCAAALAGFVFGMPGNGDFVPTIWLAGFVALLVAPGWPGFAALILGAAASAALLDVSDETFGLVFLIVAVVSALAAHGALSASVLLRLRTLGWRLGMRDGGRRLISRLTVEGLRPSSSAIERTPRRWDNPWAMSTRSASDRKRLETPGRCCSPRRTDGYLLSFPSISRTLRPWSHLVPVRRLIPTARLAAALLSPWFMSLMYSARLSVSGAPPGDFRDRLQRAIGSS